MKPNTYTTYSHQLDRKIVEDYYAVRGDVYADRLELQISGEDRFDPISHIAITTDGERCLAGMRMTVCHPEANQPLPMELDELQVAKIFPELHLESVTYGEVPRLATRPEHFRAANILIEYMVIHNPFPKRLKYIFTLAPRPQTRLYEMICRRLKIKTQSMLVTPPLLPKAYHHFGDMQLLTLSDWPVCENGDC